jgi:hypothetical protein
VTFGGDQDANPVIESEPINGEEVEGEEAD